MSILRTMSSVEYEVMFVDDDSTEGTLKILQQLSENEHVFYLSFSRNFGKESAMYAGFCNAKAGPSIRSWFARQFYRFLNRFSEADVVDGAGIID